VTVLVEWDEEGHCEICVQVCHLSVGKGGPSETIRITSAVRDPYVEIGKHFHGFHYWVAYVIEGSRFYMGSGGSVDKGSSFSAGADRLYYGIVCIVIYCQDSEVAWGAPGYHVR